MTRLYQMIVAGRAGRPGARTLAVVVLAGAVLVAGCDYSKDVKTYQKVTAAPQATTMPCEKDASIHKILSLQDALLLANNNNERLAIAGETYLQSLVEKKRAISQFLPSSSTGINYSFFDGSMLPDGVPAYQLQVPLTGSLKSNVFGDLSRLKAADLTAQGQRWLLLEAQESLLIDVARVYYQTLRAEQSAKVLENSLKVQEERVRDIRARERVGMARPLEVSQTEAQASATRVQLIDAHNQTATGRTLLAYLIDAPVQSSILADRFTLPGKLDDLSALQSQASQYRKDLQAAIQNEQAAYQRVRAAYSQYLPSAQVDLSLLLAQSPEGTTDWNGFASVYLPLFSAGRIEQDVQSAWSYYRQAEFSRRQLARQVSQEVQVNYQNFTASGKRLAELQTQVVAAEQAFRQADQSYSVGLATNLERLIAQDQMLSAQLQLASEEYDHKVFYLNILRAVGRMRGGALDVPEATAGRGEKGISVTVGGSTSRPVSKPATCRSSR